MRTRARSFPSVQSHEACALLREMGHVFADIELSNPRRPDLAPVRISALADTGSLMLCIRDVTVADGRAARVPYVGPIQIRFANRTCFVGALVLGDEPLFGAIPMEDLDLVVAPGARTVTVNPASPNYPQARVKAA